MEKPTPDTTRTVELRIVVTGPVAGCAYALQRGRADLEQVQVAAGADLQFDLQVTLKVAADGLPDAKGLHVQGPRGARFVYITCGTMAGQPGSKWTRRAKVALNTLYAAASDTTAEKFQATYAGTAKDGGPACATIPLLCGGWQRC
jgi:hypothetical protein